jgi:hypothetical protein
MTNQQILELMGKHFHPCPITNSSYIEWIGKESAFIEFAREIRKNGYEVGYACGYTDGEFSYAYNPVEDDL